MRSKFFPLRPDLILEEPHCLMKQTGSKQEASKADLGLKFHPKDRKVGYPSCNPRIGSPVCYPLHYSHFLKLLR